MIASVNAMNKSLLASAAVLSLLCFGKVACVRAEPLSEGEKAQIVSLHNTYRSQVSPSASDMAPMTWDAGIASQAEAYAAKCVTTHSHTAGLGENLAWGWPSQDVQGALGLWESEKKIFNYNGSPIPCGHYTQMVWANSRRIGCARQRCSNLSGQGQGDVYVCNYAEPGNYLNSAGLIGSPYKAGAPSQSTQLAAQPAPQPQQTSTPQPQQQPQQQQQQQPSAPAPQADSFKWTGGDSAWSSCSASCGQGTQTRNIACVNQNNQGADWSKCDQSSKPANSQACNNANCPSAPQQPQQSQPQPQQTEQPQQTSTPTPPAAKQEEAAKVEPVAVVEALTYSWKAGDYTVCNAVCGGTQSRSVDCVSSKGDVSADGACGQQERPKSSVTCNGVCPVAPPQETAPVAPQQPIVEKEAVASCNNATLVADLVSLFNSTESLNSSGLLRSDFAESSPLSLNCSAVHTYLNSTGLLNCTSFNVSSALNSTGGAQGAYALGDCFDSWFNTSLGFVDVNEFNQTHFGSLNFTSVEFKSDYNMTLYNASHNAEAVSFAVAALPVSAATSASDDAIVIAASLPSTDDLSADATQQQLAQLARYEQGDQSAATAAQTMSILSMCLVATVALLL